MISSAYGMSTALTGTPSMSTDSISTGSGPDGAMETSFSVLANICSLHGKVRAEKPSLGGIGRGSLPAVCLAPGFRRRVLNKTFRPTHGGSTLC